MIGQFPTMRDSRQISLDLASTEEPNLFGLIELKNSTYF
jgi:hypothetical protein